MRQNHKESVPNLPHVAIAKVLWPYQKNPKQVIYLDTVQWTSADVENPWLFWRCWRETINFHIIFLYFSTFHPWSSLILAMSPGHLHPADAPVLLGLLRLSPLAPSWDGQCHCHVGGAANADAVRGPTRAQLVCRTGALSGGQFWSVWDIDRLKLMDIGWHWDLRGWF